MKKTINVDNTEKLREKALMVIREPEVLAYIDARIEKRIKQVEERNSTTLHELLDMKNSKNINFFDTIRDIIKTEKTNAENMLKHEIKLYDKKLCKFIEKELIMFTKKINVDKSVSEIIMEVFHRTIGNFNENNFTILNKVFQVQIQKFDISLRKRFLKKLP